MLMKSLFDSTHSAPLSCAALPENRIPMRESRFFVHFYEKRCTLFASALSEGLVLLILKTVAAEPAANRF